MAGALLLLAAAAASAPQPATLETFRDWIVGCDNGRACQAVALMPESANLEGSILVLTRAAAAGAVPAISITVPDRGIALAIGKRRIPFSATGEIAAKDVPAVLEVLRRDPSLAVLDAAGGQVASISLSGASAAFLYMDDRQQRLGTTSALIRKGAVSIVPPPPALPVILRPAAGDAPPRTITTAEAAKQFGDIGCEIDRDALEPDAVRLDAGHSLALVMQPCGNGAYNYFGIALVVDEKGRVTPAEFDSSPGMGADTQSLVNPGWNEKTRRLDTYAKGRGLGDCGVISSFAWDGRRFRLAEQSEMGECRGSVDYITTWRTSVQDAR
jgi:hypothetical protein